MAGAASCIECDMVFWWPGEVNTEYICDNCVEREMQRHAVSHVAGVELVVEGRLQRQLCSWCGYQLVNNNLENCFVAEGGMEGPPPVWTQGTWVEVIEGNPTLFRQAEHEKGRFPANSCMAKDVPRLRLAQSGFDN